MAGLRTRTLAGAVLVALTLTACSGEGGGGLPTALPTERPTLPALPTVTLPTVALPTVTLPTVTLPSRPTADPPPPETEDEETAAPETALPETEDVTTEDEPAEEDAQDAGTGWLWLLLALIAAAAVATAVLLRRRRASADWADAVEEPLREAMWLRDTIVPNLLAQGPEGRSGIWAIGRARVLTLEQRLWDLVEQAPDPSSKVLVEALSAAVQALRRTLDQADTLIDFGGTRTVAALQQSQYELDEAIRAVRPVSEDGRNGASRSAPAAPAD